MEKPAPVLSIPDHAPKLRRAKIGNRSRGSETDVLLLMASFELFGAAVCGAPVIAAADISRHPTLFLNVDKNPSRTRKGLSHPQALHVWHVYLHVGVISFGVNGVAYMQKSHGAAMGSICNAKIPWSGHGIYMQCQNHMERPWDLYAMPKSHGVAMGSKCNAKIPWSVSLQLRGF